MIRVVLFGVLLVSPLALAGCDSKPPAAAGPPPPPVTVARPIQKTITEWDEYTGRFAAVETVEVRARVSGFIDSIHFKDGQIVKQGDLLFTIDQRPYKLAVEQAEADVERARAKLAIATLDVERAEPLRAHPGGHRPRIRHPQIHAARCRRGGCLLGRRAQARPAQSRMDRGARARSPGGSPTGASMPAISFPAARAARHC